MRLIPDDILAVVTIMQEAAGEPYAGKLAVAEVIRRRTEKHVQSDGTVAGTVLRSYQFSGWNTKPDALRIRTAQLQDTDHGTEDAQKAWRESITSRTVADAVFYCNLSVLPRPPAWATPDKFVVKIGHHSFYRI